MSDLESNLFNEAVLKHKFIYPCSNRPNFKECFTRNEDKLFFWFNTEDQSTHVLEFTLDDRIMPN